MKDTSESDSKAVPPLPGTTGRTVDSAHDGVTPPQSIDAAATAPADRAPLARSAAQVIAARHNGARSHGPTSDAGKMIASGNATTHGLTARSVAGAHLAEAERERFEEFLNGYIEEYAVSTPSEHARAQGAALHQILLEKVEGMLADSYLETEPFAPVFEQIQSHVRLLIRIFGELETGQCSVTPEESQWVCQTIGRLYPTPRGQLQDAPPVLTQMPKPTDTEFNEFREALAGGSKLSASQRAQWRVRLRDTIVELERGLTPLQQLKINDPTSYKLSRFLEKDPERDRLAAYADRHRRIRDKELEKLGAKTKAGQSFDFALALKSKGAE